MLGALSFPQGSGQAVQSVEYRSSGVIFDIRPTVREAVVELAISQQLSDFVKTTTGVNNSPTLPKRELKTTVGVQDGDVIVLGGLVENKTTRSKDGLSFLPRFLDTSSAEDSASEKPACTSGAKAVRPHIFAGAKIQWGRINSAQ